MSTAGELLTNEIEIIWKIKQFKSQLQYILNSQQSIVSPSFSAPRSVASEGYTFKLILKPSKSPNDLKYLSIFLSTYYQIQNINTKIPVLAHFFLLDNEGTKVLMHRINVIFSYGNYCWGCDNFLSVESLDKKSDILNNNNELSVVCKIMIMTPFSDSLFYESTHDLRNDFESIFLNGTFSDVTLIIGRKKIKAHKSILSSRSKVFEAMFQHAMIENTNNTVKIVDIEYNIMLELIRFIYSGKVENLQAIAQPLIAAADKYDVPSLKSVCENYLFNKLSIEEACDILNTASLYNCNSLKTQTMKFVTENLKKIVSTPGYKRLADNRSVLLSEILSNVAEYQKN